MLKYVRENGHDKKDRTGTGTKSCFGRQCRYDLQDGFPLVTTKRVAIRLIIHELLWFLAGDTNIGYLKEHNVRIWNEWADENGDLGPVYGAQWRSWMDKRGCATDQIKTVMESLANDPDSRRHIVSAWNVGDLPLMALPPCHCLFQFYVADNRLSCQLYQRSADLFLGVPFNIASYALLTHMIAHVLGYDVGEFVHTFGDAHIYTNHFPQVEEQLKREPRALPQLEIIRDVESIDDFRIDDFELTGYNPHPTLPGKVAV